MTEYVRAQDGYVRSAYFYRDRGQKLKAGPLWDYDLSFGVSCCFNSHLTGVDPVTGSGWQFNNGYNRGARENGLADTAHTAVMGRLDWTRLMMADPDFKQLFVDSWQQLRQIVGLRRVSIGNQVGQLRPGRTPRRESLRVGNACVDLVAARFQPRLQRASAAIRRQCGT